MHKVEIKNIDKSKIEITGEIPADLFESYRKKATENLSENIEIPGFRKGKVPADVLVKKIGEMPILEEMAEYAISKAYPEILAENKINAIGRPNVSITKIAKGELLGFKIQTAIMPEFSLPNYKEIASEINSKKEKVKVSDKEVKETIEQIQKQRSQIKSEKENDKDNTNELNDEFVKTLGDFKNVEDFKKQIKENIQKEKEARAQQKKKMEILENILKKTDIVLPDILIESELNKMMAQFEGDISRMGLKFDEYLKHINKTREDLMREWRDDAEKRGKIQLILNKIAVEEKLKAPKNEMEKQVSNLLKHYKEADPDNVRTYIETILINEEVFKFLENQK